MEPLAIVMACLAVFYIVLRGPLLVVPKAAAAFERRLVYATTGRLRIVGVLMLILFAAPLIVTARQAPAAHGDIVFWSEVLGWVVAASAVWVIVAPGFSKWFLNLFWDAVSYPPLLRAIGAVSVAFGLFLGWIAFFVL